MSVQDEITATIDKLVDGWNRNDMEAFSGLFIDDATYVSSVGIRLKGRQAICEGLLSNDEARSGERAKVAITNSWITLIKADVAVVHNTWEMASESAHGVDQPVSRQGVITQVLVSDGSSWRIAALQNTDVKDEHEKP